MSRADEERAYCRASAEDPRLDHGEAVAAFLIGHERTPAISWTCSCGHAGRLGESFAQHQADGVLALLTRRGLITTTDYRTEG